MLSQRCCDIRPEMCAAVQVLDVGAVDTKDVVDSERRKIPDDVVDCPLLAGHLITLTRDDASSTVGK